MNPSGCILCLSRRSNCNPVEDSWAFPTLFPGFLSESRISVGVQLLMSLNHTAEQPIYFLLGFVSPSQHTQAWLRSGNYATHLGCGSKVGCLKRTNEPILPRLQIRVFLLLDRRPFWANELYLLQEPMNIQLAPIP